MTYSKKKGGYDLHNLPFYSKLFPELRHPEDLVCTGIFSLYSLIIYTVV